ncbi:serine/threonine-protein kinase [Hyalangium gracile]|uniref:serine/threonine-protein kinase n=1 Tax=Hyalangium gracile TaxID=394092 RepID=UPI001CCFBBDF|nr:serine/threonine-protein kinase [Hyalangium gracile]
MELLSPSHPALLPLDTVVGAWRVVARAGCGVYGAVYRAVPAHDAHGAPVALKLALHPADPRFAREAELLARCQHPSIPRLLDQGCWHSSSGTSHPFLVMQWVDGVPLYDQARLQPPKPSQARRWMLQLVQALAVLHAQGAVHRDLKGGNILVRRSDGRAMLVDFGTGLYPGAGTLTPAMAFPGTPIYRSPESWLFEVRFYRDAAARYRATAADDLYALGVTVCYLLIGEYPEPAAPSRGADGTVHLEGVLLPPALLKSSTVDPVLRACALRLLSVDPAQGGTAAQLAQELESTLEPALSVPRHVWRKRALAAAAVLALSLGVWRALPGKPPQAPSVARAESSGAESGEVGTTGLGEAAAELPQEKAPTDSSEEVLGAAPLPKPEPGQLRPDQRGLCPIKGQVILNGVCWWIGIGDAEKCLELGGQVVKDTCYVPVILPKRKNPPTSGP